MIMQAPCLNREVQAAKPVPSLQWHQVASNSQLSKEKGEAEIMIKTSYFLSGSTEVLNTT
jgi:hypothetical protein